MNRIDKNYRLAETFRRGIELTTFECFPMNHFPLGCCGEASMLLSQYYIDNGIQAWYQNGNYHTSVEGIIQSHAWIVLEKGIIVDITGDQFKNKFEYGFFDTPVYVGKEKAFHKMFIKEALRPGGYRVYDEATVRRCDALYKLILESIDLWNKRSN